MLRLPAELRLDVFKKVFRDTTLRYGFNKGLDTSILKSVNASQIDNVQTTCKKFHEETQDWIKHVTFDFYSTETFVDFFSRISGDRRRQIRNIRVKSFLFPLYKDEDAGSYFSFCFSNVLPLFPGLQLDHLFVVDAFHHEPGVNDGFGDRGACTEFEGLLESDGWKELHFISRTPEMLTWSPPHYYDNGNLVAGGSHPSKTRPAQPFEWHAKLLRRDGQDSGAFVQMFWGKNFGSGTTERRADCMAIHQPDPSTIESVDVDPNTGEANRWKVDELAHMNHDKSPTREVRLVARRGNQAAYTETGSSLHETLRYAFDKHGWEGLKEKGLLLDGTSDPCAHL